MSCPIDGPMEKSEKNGSVGVLANQPQGLMVGERIMDITDGPKDLKPATRFRIRAYQGGVTKNGIEVSGGSVTIERASRGTWAKIQPGGYRSSRVQSAFRSASHLLAGTYRNVHPRFASNLKIGDLDVPGVHIPIALALRKYATKEDWVNAIAGCFPPGFNEARAAFKKASVQAYTQNRASLPLQPDPDLVRHSREAIPKLLALIGLEEGEIQRLLTEWDDPDSVQRLFVVSVWSSFGNMLSIIHDATNLKLGALRERRGVGPNGETGWSWDTAAAMANRLPNGWFRKNGKNRLFHPKANARLDVEIALSRGEDVPNDRLAAYPDLLMRYGAS